MTEAQASELGPLLVYLVTSGILTIEQAYELRPHEDLIEMIATEQLDAAGALSKAEERNAEAITQPLKKGVSNDGN